MASPALKPCLVSTLITLSNTSAVTSQLMAPFRYWENTSGSSTNADLEYLAHSRSHSYQCWPRSSGGRIWVIERSAASNSSSLRLRTWW